jgi:hypothetical protein
MVLGVAFRLARRVLPERMSKFARHDFTQPQLFACLVLKQFCGLSYRHTEQLLRDSPGWLADIGMRDAPDHNTLWRAMSQLISRRAVDKLMQATIDALRRPRKLGLSRKPLAIDSTCFEHHHRSRHYDRRCRQMLSRKAASTHEESVEKPGKWGEAVNRSRSRALSRMPKLAVAVASGCHLILAAKASLGGGSDAPDFDDLLYQSWRRAPVRVVVADSGYDSEANHRLARLDMGVRSIIPPGIGRPTTKPPQGRWRRHMAKRFAKKADQKQYVERSQSETVHSMMKRNQGSALRSRTPERQKAEMLLRALTHNIAIIAELENKGRD